MLGDDVLYVEKWPWISAEDWWNLREPPHIQARGRGQAEPDHRGHAQLGARIRRVRRPCGRPRSRPGATASPASSRAARPPPTGASSPRTSARAACSMRPRTTPPARWSCWASTSPRPSSPAAPALGETVSSYGPAVPGDRRPRAPGVVPRPLQLRQPDGHAARRLPEVLRHPQRQHRDPGQDQGQDPHRRGARGADRRHAPRARAGPGRAATISRSTAGTLFKEKLDPIKTGDRPRRALRDRPRALRRGHRDHEHHLREREGAHEGDRDPQGARGPPPARSSCSS